MQIRIQYEAQARRAAGIGSETVDVPADCGVGDCIRQLAESHGEPLQPVLVNADGDIQPTLLIFRNDCQVAADDDSSLSDGDSLTLMPPISGG